MPEGSPRISLPDYSLDDRSLQASMSDFSMQSLLRAMCEAGLL